jgi:hypothetical protein
MRKPPHNLIELALLGLFFAAFWPIDFDQVQ